MRTPQFRRCLRGGIGIGSRIVVSRAPRRRFSLISFLSTECPRPMLSLEHSLLIDQRSNHIYAICSDLSTGPVVAELAWQFGKSAAAKRPPQESVEFRKA